MPLIRINLYIWFIGRVIKYATRYNRAAANGYSIRNSPISSAPTTMCRIPALRKAMTGMRIVLIIRLNTPIPVGKLGKLSL